MNADKEANASVIKYTPLSLTVFLIGLSVMFGSFQKSKSCFNHPSPFFSKFVFFTATVINKPPQ